MNDRFNQPDMLRHEPNGDGQMLTAAVPLELTAASGASRFAVEGYVAKKMHKLKATLRNLESFNRNVAHDLRNPLGNIASLTAVARSKIAQGDAGGADRLLSLVHGEAMAATDLLTALLGLAVAENAAIERQPVSLQELAEKAVLAVSSVEPGFDTDHIEMSGEFPIIQGDPCLLKQVFVNLIGNAVKFSQPSSPVEITGFRKPGSVCVQVADRGIGFDQVAADRLFEPFFRINSQESKGHGLGLSIVSRIVERHGGSVHARARPGGGAVLEFALPIDEASRVATQRHDFGHDAATSSHRPQ